MGYAEEKQRQLDVRYLKMARIWAENSYCVRRQVGALIVKDKMIISDGYNGTPSGFENICEDDMGQTKPYVLHAEANAITKVERVQTTARGQRCILLPLLVWSAQNSLFRLVSSAWFTARSTVARMVSSCLRESVLSVYL